MHLKLCKGIVSGFLKTAEIHTGHWSQSIATEAVPTYI